MQSLAGSEAPVQLALAMGQTFRSLNLNGRSAFLSAGLPSPSSLRDATSPKVRGLGSPPSFPFYTLRPAAARGAVRRYAQTSRLCQGLPLWGSWTPLGGLRGRGRWREPCTLGLALPYGSAALSEARSKPRLCAASAGLALSVIASRCHLSQSERFLMYRKVCLLEKAPPLGELARSA